MNIRCNKNLLTVTNGYTKKQTKLMNIRCNKNLLTVTNGYSRTVKKSWKNAVLAKYAANHQLKYERSDKHATSLKGLLCCRYVKHIDKLKGFKSEWIKSSTNFYRQHITKIRLLTASGETIIKSERCKFGSYK